MTENMSGLNGLVAETQRWWNEQHTHCASREGDPLGRPWDSMGWLYSQEDLGLGRCPMCGWQDDRNRDQLIASLRSELSARAVRAAGFLKQPDVRVAAEVAMALVPTPYGAELTLLTDLIEAAGAETVMECNQALVGAGMAAGLLLLGLSAVNRTLRNPH